MEVVLTTEVGTELVIRNASSAIASVLVSLVALSSAMIVVHLALLFRRPLLAPLIALITFLLIALLLILWAACFRLSLALVLTTNV
jgi:hypothetical protein